MASPIIQIITSADPHIRNQSLDAVCATASAAELLAACEELEIFRRRSENLYERVRALFFLYAIHRFHLPDKLPAGATGMIPFKGFEHLLQRRFEEALEQFLAVQKQGGPSDAVCSALAAVYSGLAFKRSPIRCVAACVPCAATNGCFAWGIPWITHCASVPNCCIPPPTGLIPSCAKPRRCGWIDAIPAGAIFSFSAWISRREPAS